MINTYFLEKQIEILGWSDLVQFNCLDGTDTPVYSPEEKKDMEERRQELLNQLHDIKYADYE